MSAVRHRWLWLLILILGLAFALRIYRLDAIPLRGDETFTIRYMGGDPRDTLRDFVQVEPYPAGGFLSVWAWKSLAGDTAFTMRYLPALGDWIGVAAIAVLARRLFRQEGVALLAAALWAIHPLLIWHAQDARSNYALWAGLSALAMALFIRAAARNRPRDWALYLAAETVAFYVFFLEAFVLVVQGLFLLIRRAPRSVWRRAIGVWIALGVLLIPWLAHVYLLASSGYAGTIEPASPQRLVTWIFGTLLLGEQPAAPWDAILPLAWVLLVALILALRPNLPRRTLIWLAAWVVVPVALLYIAATRMSVFHPRYLLAVVPALVLLTARAAWPLQKRRPVLAVAQLSLLVLPLLQAGTLIPYYRGDNPKSPDWPALATFFDTRATASDVIVLPAPDPSLAYYYRGPADEATLTSNTDPAALLRPEVNFRSGIWLIGGPSDAHAFLDENMQRVSEQQVAGFRVVQYRRGDVRPSEIAQASGAQFGDFVRLDGFTLQGPDPVTQAVTVMLYWEPLRRTETDYVVFVHLAGPGTSNDDAGPLVDQDDHRPRDGFASTLSWALGDLVRDPYHLLDVPAELAPGTYRLIIGFYDPADPDARVPVSGADGTPLGDALVLPAFEWPLSAAE